MDSIQLDGVERVDQVSEHAGSSEGGELHRIADEDEAPLPLLGEVEELGQLRCGHHRGFVADDGRADWQVVAVVRWSFEAVLDEQLVEGVGVDARVDGEHLGCRSGRGDTEHHSALTPKLLDTGS